MAGIKEVIEKLKINQDKAQTIATKYSKAIYALRELCKHDYDYTGHGHNDSYYQCSKCGKETSY